MFVIIEIQYFQIFLRYRDNVLMNLEMRYIVPDEYASFMVAAARGFGWHWDESNAELAKPDQDRSIAVFDSNKIVGCAHSFNREINVPGGKLGCAAVDDVTVLPTHRRRGILTKMMLEQLNNFYERGESIAALFPTESLIYGRYGYGIGTPEESWKIDTRHSDYINPFESKGELSFIESEIVPRTFPNVFANAMKNRPGSIQPTQHRWERKASDRQKPKGDRSGYFHVKYERDGKIEGYVRYHLNNDTVVVDELISETIDAHASLWRYCFDIDLRWNLEARHRPADDILPWILSDPRHLIRKSSDGLWIRIVDILNALSYRCYADTGSVVLEIIDPLCPWNEGRFELDSSPEGSRCRQTSKGADLIITIENLATVYLGGTTFSLLNRAGRADEIKDGSIARADAIFKTVLKPWCAFHF